MASPLPNSDNTKGRVDGKVWDMIFIDTKIKTTKKKAAVDVEPTAPVTAQDIDIRTWSFGDRKLLASKGDRVNILVGDTQVITISKPLLRATSVTAKDILRDGNVMLPYDTDKDGVCRLVKYLESIVQTDKKSLLFHRDLSMAVSLGVCAAASALGMRKYVVHLYKKCEAILRQDLPTYEDMDAIIAFKEAHFRLFKFVVEGLATHVFEGTIPDPGDFTLYLTQKPVLDKAIKKSIEDHKYEIRKGELLEQRCVKQDYSRAQHDNWVERNAERKAKKQAEEQAFFGSQGEEGGGAGEVGPGEDEGERPEEAKVYSGRGCALPAPIQREATQRMLDHSGIVVDFY